MQSGCCCRWMTFFRHFYSFLKWNRIFGDNRGGQDNWWSQIALHSESKSSLTPRVSSNAPSFFLFSSCLALKFLSYTMKMVCSAVITCMTSLCQSQSAGRPWVHKHTLSHTQLGTSGTNPQALWSPWHRPDPFWRCQQWPWLSSVNTGCVFSCPDYMPKNSTHNLSHHSSSTKNWTQHQNK